MMKKKFALTTFALVIGFSIVANVEAMNNGRRPTIAARLAELRVAYPNAVDEINELIETRRHDVVDDLENRLRDFIATNQAVVVPQDNNTATETEVVVPQDNNTATETEVVVPQNNNTATETEVVVPQNNNNQNVPPAEGRSWSAFTKEKFDATCTFASENKLATAGIVVTSTTAIALLTDLGIRGKKSLLGQLYAKVTKKQKAQYDKVAELTAARNKAN